MKRSVIVMGEGLVSRGQQKDDLHRGVTSHRGESTMATEVTKNGLCKGCKKGRHGEDLYVRQGLRRFGLAKDWGVSCPTSILGGSCQDLEVVSKPPFLSHEWPSLGGLLTMVINYLLTVMILQVSTLSTVHPRWDVQPSAPRAWHWHENWMASEGRSLQPKWNMLRVLCFQWVIWLVLNPDPVGPHLLII